MRAGVMERVIRFHSPGAAHGFKLPMLGAAVNNYSQHRIDAIVFIVPALMASIFPTTIRVSIRPVSRKPSSRIYYHRISGTTGMGSLLFGT